MAEQLSETGSTPEVKTLPLEHLRAIDNATKFWRQTLEEAFEGEEDGETLTSILKDGYTRIVRAPEDVSETAPSNELGLTFKNSGGRSAQVVAEGSDSSEVSPIDAYIEKLRNKLGTLLKDVVELDEYTLVIAINGAATPGRPKVDTDDMDNVLRISRSIRLFLPKEEKEKGKGKDKKKKK